MNYFHNNKFLRFLDEQKSLQVMNLDYFIGKADIICHLDTISRLDPVTRTMCPMLRNKKY